MTTASEDTPDGVSSSDTTELRRLHPLTPVLGSWRWVAAFGALVLSQGGREADPVVYGVAAVVMFPAAVIYGVVAWWATRYRISSGDLLIETGVLFRRSRRVRVDRLQAVDVVRPFVGRLLGLAELRLEVVGGSSSEAPLAYLSNDDAYRLRAELLARAAGLRPDVPEAPERPLLKVPRDRLLGATLLRPFFFLSAFVVVGALVAMAAGFWEAVTVLPPVLLGMVGQAYAAFVRQYDFTVADSPDGVRLRAGLLDTRAQTVPPGRVQAFSVVRPVLWKLFTDWHRVEINVAGYRGGEASQTTTLVPVATPPEVRLVLSRVALEGNAETVPLIPVPRQARLLSPFEGPWVAAGMDPSLFVVRRGFLGRRLSVVSHAKVQSFSIRQGPLQRRFGLASLAFDSTPGPVFAVAPHLPMATAAALLAEGVDHARRGRARAIPEQWRTAPSG